MQSSNEFFNQINTNTDSSSNIIKDAKLKNSTIYPANSKLLIKKTMPPN